MFLWGVSGVLISPKIKEKNTTRIIGHFDHIDKKIGSGRSSGVIWYNLYIQENTEFYRISGDNSQCVLYDKMLNELKIGDQIRFFINKPTFLSIQKPMVVGIISNGREYLSFDCVNQETKKERVYFPLVFLIMGLYVSYNIYKKDLLTWFKKK